MIDEADRLRMASSQQPEVAASDADDDRNGFWIQRRLRELDARRRPVLFKQLADLWCSERPELMDDADAGIELRIARETFLQSRHADQDQTNFLGIKNRAYLLHRLLTQIQRILEINTLAEVTKAVVEAARESLVIGPV